ncbi:MAG: NAD-dependent formate dehydrogenase [Rubrobacter sp.]|nr:NAD-dependent formate dehydrogenase [Rubrobacter sp.]
MKVVAVLYPGKGHKVEYGDWEGQPIPGSDEGELDLREWIEDQGHEYVVTTAREGDELYQHLQDAEVLITTPFWPVYVTSEVMDQAPNLRAVFVAGVGSDHIDLAEAANRNILVAEQTGSNVVSVAEHAVMCILNLLRNFVPSYKQVVDGEWDIAALAKRAYDLEGKTVGIFGAGQIGQLIASRLKPFDVKMLYYKRTPLSIAEEENFGFRYSYFDDMLDHCDIIIIAAPQTPETKGAFNRDSLSRMKRGAWIVNIARGGIVDRDALVEALEDGHIAGYAGDVWDPEPAPPDHPWRTMPNHMMTPHTAGTTLDAQQTYIDGTRRCLEAFFNGEPVEDIRVIVEDGEIVSGTYSAVQEA